MNLLTHDRLGSAGAARSARATALILDARRGGCALARSLAREGFAVVLAHAPRDAGIAAQTVAALCAEGAHAAGLLRCGGAEHVIARVFDRAEDRFGRVDVLVDNTMAPLPAVSEDDELFDRHFGAPLRGMVEVVRAAAPRLQLGGRIVHLSDARSSDAPSTQAWMSPLEALEWLTQTFSAELAAYGVRINSIAPSAECGDRVLAESIALLLGADGDGCNGRVFDVGAAALHAIGVPT